MDIKRYFLAQGDLLSEPGSGRNHRAKIAIWKRGVTL
jgi:hypothetical protein